MADMSNIRTDISPSQVTIDNIGEWDGYSVSAINQIDNEITGDRTTVGNMLNVFNSYIDRYHHIGQIEDRDSVQRLTGGVFFIKKQQEQTEVIEPSEQEIEGENE